MTSLGGWAESAGSDNLPESLVFKIPAQSTAVAKREQTEFQVSGSSTYSPAGQRVMRFPLTDAVSWLQPDSCYLKFFDLALLKELEFAMQKYLHSKGSFQFRRI